MRDQQQHVRRERQYRRMRIEGQEETEQRRGPKAFAAAPQGTCQRIGQQAREPSHRPRRRCAAPRQSSRPTADKPRAPAGACRTRHPDRACRRASSAAPRRAEAIRLPTERRSGTGGRSPEAGTIPRKIEKRRRSLSILDKATGEKTANMNIREQLAHLAPDGRRYRSQVRELFPAAARRTGRRIRRRTALRRSGRNAARETFRDRKALLAPRAPWQL